MKKSTLLIIPMLFASFMVTGCQPESKTSEVDEKIAYASSSALSFVNQTNSPSSRQVKSLSTDTNPLEDLLSQFDTLFDAKSNLKVELIENKEGDYAYTSKITIGEQENFIYSLNYNKEVNENIITENGQLVVNYTPYSFDFSLNFESVITYNDDMTSGTINFKLFTNLLNKEDLSTYVEVSESLNDDSNFNKFNYKFVIADKEIMNYAIEIPYGDENKLTVTFNDMVYVIEKTIVDGVTTIKMSATIAGIEVISLTYEKTVDETGMVTYKLSSNNS